MQTTQDCAFCGQSFVKSSGRQWRRIYCDSSCASKSRNRRQNIRRRGLLLSRTCKSCGETFQPTNTAHWHCTNGCRQRYVERLHKEARRAERVNRTCHECSGDIESARNGNARFCGKCSMRRGRKTSTCAVCGDSLSSARKSYCSDCLKSTAYQRNRAAVYGISLFEYRRIIARGQCQICEKRLYERKTSAPMPSDVGHIDHDHRTGAVRGYLCRDCNHLLGNAGDSIERLQKAARYLEMSN